MREDNYSIYDVPVHTIAGDQTTLAQYRGKVLLIVNVASKCGYTSQYGGLEQLYQAYRERGLVVLGFPCNQFGRQEPGSPEEIQSFCELNFGVTFPLFSKIDVNGPNAHALYRLLKTAQPGLLGTEAIKWNFTKFLVDTNGAVVGRFGPTTAPHALRVYIEQLLSP